MAETRVFFQSNRLQLEGLLDNAPGEAAVVVTHPHPLYGGEMYNNVVEAIVAAYGKKDYATFRFNFRGVGGSEGTYDDGIGEQVDVAAALKYVLSLGKTSVDLVGYSFGAWVNAMGNEGVVHAHRLIMVSPPVSAFDFSFLENNQKIKLVLTGSEDDYAPPKILQDMVPRWNPEADLRIVQDTDHFYWGKTGEIEEIIQGFLESALTTPDHH